jgi:hypothetical protein
MFLGACLKIQKKVKIKYRTDVGVCKRFSSLPYDIGLPPTGVVVVFIKKLDPLSRIQFEL